MSSNKISAPALQKISRRPLNYVLNIGRLVSNSRICLGTVEDIQIGELQYLYSCPLSLHNLQGRSPTVVRFRAILSNDDVHFCRLKKLAVLFDLLQSPPLNSKTL